MLVLRLFIKSGLVSRSPVWVFDFSLPRVWFSLVTRKASMCMGFLRPCDVGSVLEVCTDGRSWAQRRLSEVVVWCGCVIWNAHPSLSTWFLKHCIFDQCLSFSFSTTSGSWSPPWGLWVCFWDSQGWHLGMLKFFQGWNAEKSKYWNPVGSVFSVESTGYIELSGRWTAKFRS